MKFICKLIIWHKIYTNSSSYFIKKNCKPLKLIFFDIHPYLDYLQFQNLYLLKLYLTVFFLSSLNIYHRPYHVENKLYQDHFYECIICISCLHKFFSSFFAFSEWTTSTISKSGCFKSISGITLSPTNKNLFPISFIFILNEIAFKTKHHLTMEFYSMVL